jgi:cob(I)alamin adenosyltransferase
MVKLVEIYTGNGRGKTTAALGVVLRAVGHGLRVHIVFFMKGNYPYGEQAILAQLPEVSFSRYGADHLLSPDDVNDNQREQGRLALDSARAAMLSGQYDLVVLDEVNIASAWAIVAVDEVVKLIKDKPEGVALILTGRYADQRLIDMADLVTEMIEVKHPYTKGVLSREGFDY